MDAAANRDLHASDASEKLPASTIDMKTDIESRRSIGARFPIIETNVSNLADC